MEKFPHRISLLVQQEQLKVILSLEITGTENGADIDGYIKKTIAQNQN